MENALKEGKTEICGREVTLERSKGYGFINFSCKEDI